MKPEIVSSEKNSLKLRFSEVDRGVLNLIREELWNDKATQMAGFQITHPQVGEALFTLKVKGKDAKSAWNAAVGRLSKQVTELESSLKKL